MSLGPHRKSETILANPNARMQNNARANDSVRDAGPRTNVTITTNRYSIAYYCTGSDGRTATNMRLPTNDSARLDDHTFIEPSGGMNEVPPSAFSSVFIAGIGGDWSECINVEEP